MSMPTHIVAAAGIVERNGEILLVKTYRHGWVFPGGQVENGETLTTAAEREIFEESGITASAHTLFCVSSNTGAYDNIPTKVMFDFLCAYVCGEPGSSDEISESRWVKQEAVLDYITASSIRERFQAYLNFQGAVHYLSYVTNPAFRLEVRRQI